MAKVNLVGQIAGGLMAWDWSPRLIAADLCMLDSRLQKRLAELVFGVVSIWASHAVDAGPDHPLYAEYQAARSMVRNRRI